MAAENIIGNGVTEVLKKLSSLIFEEIKLAWGFKDDLKKLQITVNMMLAVIADAEKRQLEDKAVRFWLKRLEDLAYEADDILDDFSYERMRRADQLKRKRDKVRNFFSQSNPLVFRFQMAKKIKDINRKFDELEKQKKMFDLQAINLAMSNIMIVDDVKSRENKETYSYGDHSKIVGRENDQKNILEMVMNTDGSGTDRISVIPIVGMGGLGKTTLAKLVYGAAELVNEQFEPRIWVCVSDVFDLKKILRDLIDAITKTKCIDVSSKEVMIAKLHEELRGKKYFLVLDDMWTEKHEEWMELKEILGVGDKRSRIIVTTRSNKVASIVKGSLPPYELQKLSDEECWSVFEQSAFETGEIVNQNLVDIGREMVKKCKGLPLAARILGGVVHSREEEDEWKSIRNNEICGTLLEDQNNSILPILKLSYDRLPLPLKECFSYCAIFPKDFEFERKILIQLWSAEGFLDHQRNNKEMEDIGNEYFHSLLRNSLFQDAEKDDFGNIVSCKMHDLLHDLAQTISGNVVLANRETSVIKTGCGESFRLGLDIDDNNSIVLEALNSKQKLRTCLVRGTGRVDQSIVDNVIGAKRMRVLDLSSIWVEKLPPSVGNLKHLRYLDLSGNRGLILPGSIIQLYNLETLILGDCKLEVLPDDIGSLKNLRYLDLSWNTDIIVFPESITGLTNLQTLILQGCCNKLAFDSGIGSLKKLRNLDISHIRMDVLPVSITALTDLQTLNFMEGRVRRMPRGFGRLSNLQTLRYFGVPTPEEEMVDMVAGIGELEHLNLLRGGLQIYHLEYVKDGIDAQRANLKGKSNIDGLILEWGNRSDGFDKDEVVLEGLQPHPNLKKLKINSFMGEKLPTWLNSSCILRLLPNLVEIKLYFLERFEQLSGLGQLPKLKRFSLCRMEQLERWEEEEETSTTTTTNEKSLFPCLEELEILWCHNLRITPTLFPSLKQLNVSIINAMVVRSLVRRSNHLTSLCIDGISELKLLPRDLLQPKLHFLAITNCRKFQGFVQNEAEEDEDEMCSFFDASYIRKRLTSLTKLIIHYEESQCFPVALGCLTSLEELEIRCFDAPSTSRKEGNIIQQQQQQEQNCFRSLRKLLIDRCYSLDSLPQQIQCLTKLQQLEIRNIVDMVALPHWVGNLSLLTKLEILNCFELTHLQSEQVMRRLTSLEKLYIYGVSETADSFPADGIQHLVSSLLELHIDGSSNLNITSLPDQIQHLTSLRWLSLRGFNGLLELPEWLGNFSSLGNLSIRNCENLKYLPSEEAMKRLTALSYLSIYKCPLLLERCTKETGEEWHKISHIDYVRLFD